MSTLARAIAFAFLFCADVHVHADRSDAFLAEKREILELSGGKLTMTKGSLIRRESEDIVQLIRGDFYYDGSELATFRTPFATFSCGGGECRMLIERRGDKVEIKNLRGSVVVKRMGEEKNYLLPTAMQVEIGTVTSKGWADMEFPQSLPWNETARRWAALYPGELKDFKQTLEEFRADWREAVEAVSSLHLERAGREIASAKRAADQAAQRAAAEDREDAKYRELFRKKNEL